MVADVTMIGTGGRLYRDAREKERATKSAATVKAFQKRTHANPVPPVEDAEEPSPIEDKPLPPASPPWVVKPHYEEPAAKRDWTELQSTLLELAGVSALSVGFGMMYLPLGIVVLGVCLLAMGVALGLPDGFTFRRRR